MKRSKAYKVAAELVDRERLYSPLEAAKLAKETSKVKLDATVEGWARRLAAGPPVALAQIKRMLNESFQRSMAGRAVSEAADVVAAYDFGGLTSVVRCALAAQSINLFFSA